MNTTLQIPINKSLKLAAQEQAFKQGFSSLQELIRVFLTKLAEKTVTVTFGERFPQEILTPRQESILNNKYKTTIAEVKKGNYHAAHNVDEMMRYLES